jgi:hypothetical protein
VNHTPIALRHDLEDVLAAAPSAVESFYPGHWELMTRLEEQAISVVASGAFEGAVDFLSDVAVLKQPYRIDRRSVCEQIRTFPNEVSSALDALRHVNDLDYRAMDVLSNVPWFGRNGGRAFNSAVMRLVRPEVFGIIDWRNLAVIMGAPGFEGFVEPPLQFVELTPDDVLNLKGHLRLTQDIYEEYNNALRALARRHNKKVAEIDLSLWAYSARKRPFRLSNVVGVTDVFLLRPSDRHLLQGDHYAVANNMVQAYLANLKDRGLLSRQRIAEELRAIFLLVRNECELFGRNKRGRLRDKIKQVVNALDDAIARKNDYRLLEQWSRWHGMLDPASPHWIGINLPTDMVLEGYLVFEDFLPVKEYLEAHYEPETLQTRMNVD